MFWEGDENGIVRWDSRFWFTWKYPGSVNVDEKFHLVAFSLGYTTINSTANYWNLAEYWYLEISNVLRCNLTSSILCQAFDSISVLFIWHPFFFGRSCLQCYKDEFLQIFIIFVVFSNIEVSHWVLEIHLEVLLNYHLIAKLSCLQFTESHPSSEIVAEKVRMYVERSLAAACERVGPFRSLVLIILMLFINFITCDG